MSDGRENRKLTSLRRFRGRRPADFQFDREEAHRRTGFLKDKIRVPEDFDRMGADEIEAAFGGKTLQEDDKED